MVRLSLVNMYSTGSLTRTSSNTTRSLTDGTGIADVVLANPPFMSRRGESNTTDSGWDVKRSEVLFLAYFLEHLTPHGKAGVIVPEGIHFVAQSGHVQLRHMLLESGFLLADITLPHGVFKPYASVKTHILINLISCTGTELNRSCSLELENDGYSQSDTEREPVQGSQLEAAAECVIGFKQSAARGEAWSHGIRGLRAYAVDKTTLRARHLTSWGGGTTYLIE